MIVLALIRLAGCHSQATCPGGRVVCALMNKLRFLRYHDKSQTTTQRDANGSHNGEAHLRANWCTAKKEELSR